MYPSAGINAAAVAAAAAARHPVSDGSLGQTECLSTYTYLLLFILKFECGD